jgi:transcription elongation GreA/GreB family factor
VAFSKLELKGELTAQLQQTLSVLEHAHAAAVEGATHEEAKPEDDKDTRGLEQSYLARGQAQRIETLRNGLAALSAMRTEKTTAGALSALIECTDEDEETHWFFLVPSGGGNTLKQGRIKALTLSSPLGSAFVGKGVGDEVEVSQPRGTRVFAIRSVH